VRELELPGAAKQQLATHRRLKFLELHAQRRLGPVDLGRRARERAGVDRGHEALQPVDLQVSHVFDKQMDNFQIMRFSL